MTDPAAAQSANDSNAGRWRVFLGQWGPCPQTALPAGGVPPAVIAAAWWEAHGQDLLAKPAPRIDPGYALAGKTAYLQTGGMTGQSFSNPTPPGALVISAKGEFYVDWGDGTGLSGPYDTTGGPWPSGQITHVWADAGTYTVTVIERWTATWALAGQTGQLTALRTQGEIAAFPVRQLESVRNR
ncbi:MAG TPA: hypothetical protein VFA11_15155 [Acidimicrobiales bacterium]|nr:hypothetical protein [Acidimicrobiales bacterium]